MSIPDSCPICARGRPNDVLVELQATWVTAPRRAPLPGYVCVVSRVHVDEPYQLQEPHRSGFWSEVLAVADAVRTATRSRKMNYEIHGNTISHLHLHLFPRYEGDPFEGRPIDPGLEPGFDREEEELATLRDAIAYRFG